MAFVCLSGIAILLWLGMPALVVWLLVCALLWAAAIMAADLRDFLRECFPSAQRHREAIARWVGVVGSWAVSLAIIVPLLLWR